MLIRVSTWMGDRLGIHGAVDILFCMAGMQEPGSGHLPGVPNHCLARVA